MPEKDRFKFNCGCRSATLKTLALPEERTQEHVDKIAAHAEVLKGCVLWNPGRNCSADVSLSQK